LPPRMSKVELYAAIRRDSKTMSGRELQPLLTVLAAAQATASAAAAKAVTIIGGFQRDARSIMSAAKSAPDQDALLKSAAQALRDTITVVQGAQTDMADPPADPGTGLATLATRHVYWRNSVTAARGNYLTVDKLAMTLTMTDLFCGEGDRAPGWARRRRTHHTPTRVGGFRLR
jgi:hypothetical protein